MYAALNITTPEMEKASLRQGAMALGLKGVEALDSPAGKAIAKDVDFLTLVSKDDPPQEEQLSLPGYFIKHLLNR